MDSKKKISLSWSGGKDSALALNRILRSQEFDVVSLHTLFDEDTHRVGMHGIPEQLIEDQARLLGLPLDKLYLSKSENNLAYEKLLDNFYRSQSNNGVTHIGFGDLFLEDLKRYREELIRPSGLIPVFPLWSMDTNELFEQFLRDGFSTVLCAVNEPCYQAGLLGKMMDDEFKRGLPEGADLFGENGEFHTFCINGPDFHQPVAYTRGETVRRTYAYQFKDSAGNIVSQESPFYFLELTSRT